MRKRRRGGRKLEFTYQQLCDLAGGEEYLKGLRHPVTNELFFKAGKNPFPNWKQEERKGFPQHFVMALLLDRIKRTDETLRQVDRLTPELHGVAIQMFDLLVRTLKEKGMTSPEWRAIKALLER